MGTTLENGVYLPSEGERNCYAGLKTNWEILDQKVADVTALQQAVAGALHREVVESLPTTDIDPNTIYMILSGTSATENVYNEYMYVNNAWELIGTSATDLTNYYTKAEVDGKLLLKANDSDVVHKSGNETVGGIKTFSDNMTLYNSSASVNPVALFFKNKKVVIGSTTNIGSQNIAFRDSADTNLSILKTSCESVGNTSFEIKVYNKNSNNQTVSGGMLISQTPVNTYITPTTDNAVLFGSTNRRWSKIYGTEYYYGANNVEFSTKFVTTDTDQTVDGKKQLNAYLTLNGSQMNNEFSNNARTCAYLTANRDTVGKSGVFVSKFRQNKAQGAMSGTDVVQVCFDVFENEVRTNKLWYLNWFDWNNDVPETVEIRSMCNKVDYKLTHINGLNPSSLSLPSGNASDIIDISSYLTDLTGSNANTYIAPANGWISITMSNCSGIQAYITGLWGHQVIRPSAGAVRFLMPILKDKTANILIFGGTIEYARFIPCQGNV